MKRELSTSDLIIRAQSIIHCTTGGESLADSMSPEEWLQVVRCSFACDYDIPPPHWSEEQIEAAKTGTVPTFEDDL